MSNAKRSQPRGLSIVGLGFLLAGLCPGTYAQNPPDFGASIELVRIGVVVVDRNGQSLADLTAADFTVEEDSRIHEILKFDQVIMRPDVIPNDAPAEATGPLEPIPERDRHFLVLFDDVHLSAPSAERVRMQLTPFLETMRPNDWVTIRSSSTGMVFTARTPREKACLPQVISALRGSLVRDPFGDRLDEFELMRRVEYGNRLPENQSDSGADGGLSFGDRRDQLAEEAYAVAKRRIRQSLLALSQAIESLDGFPGRRTVIMYSEGFIKSPSVPEFERVTDRARRGQVALYVIDPRGLVSGLPMPGDKSSASGRSPLMALDTLAAGSSYLATSTGGRVSVSNDATDLFREAAVESSTYYVLGFAPFAGKSGERRIGVHVHREGVKVRAPDRYYVGPSLERSERVAPAIEATRRIADLAGLPLRVSTLFLRPGQRHSSLATVAIEVGSSGNNAVGGQVDLLIEARPAKGGAAIHDSATGVLPASDTRLLVRELEMTPGVWQARVVIRDRRTGGIGSLLHTFEVPPNSGLFVSSPILTAETPSEGASLSLGHLRRTYRMDQTLYCYYRVFGAGLDPSTGRPRVTGGFTVSASGRSVMGRPPTPIEPSAGGELTRLLGIGLAGLAPGPYALTLSVTDEVGGEVRDLTESFAIAPPTDE